MANSTTVLTAERILAIDLGKYKPVECRDDASSSEVTLASFGNTRSELVQRLTRRPFDGAGDELRRFRFPPDPHGRGRVGVTPAF